jgi:hypothetical protein
MIKKFNVNKKNLLNGNKDRHGIHSINIKKLLFLNKDRFIALSNAIKYRKNFYFKKPKKI